MVIDHTVDDNVSMSGSSSNSSTTTRFYNFGTDNIVVRVFDRKTKIERPNVIDLRLNSDIDNNDNDAHSVTSISSSSTFSSVQIIEPPPSSIPLVTPDTQGSDCNREGDNNSSWYLSKFSFTMTKNTHRTNEQQIADIASGRSTLSLPGIGVVRRLSILHPSHTPMAMTTITLRRRRRRKIPSHPRQLLST